MPQITSLHVSIDMLMVFRLVENVQDRRADRLSMVNAYFFEQRNVSLSHMLQSCLKLVIIRLNRTCYMEIRDSLIHAG